MVSFVLQYPEGPEGKLSPLQALFSPPGLQQMQQFLQQVANNNGGTGGTPTGTGGPGFNPAQLHHFMQQQQTFLNHHQVKKPRIIHWGKNSIYPKIHILKISFLTEFTF